MSYDNAAEQYKQITGLVTQADRELRRQDKEKAAKLSKKLAADQEQIDIIIEQERATKIGVKLHWEAVIEELYHEHWMLIAPMPKPNKNVPDQPLAYFDAEVGRTYEVLLEALSKKTFFSRIRER